MRFFFYPGQPVGLPNHARFTIFATQPFIKKMIRQARHVFFKLFSVLVFFSILLSCSKEEVSNDPLVGTWEATSFITSVPVDENGDGVKNTDLMEEVGCISMRCGFGINGSVSIESSHMTYEIDIVDGKVVMTPKGCEASTERGTWTVNDAYTQLAIDFVLDGSGALNSVSIDITLTESQLIMKDMVYEEGEEPVLYTIEFKRV